MAFRHRRHRLRFGLPEALLIPMVALSIVPAAVWLATFHGLHWHRTTAVVSGAEYEAGSLPDRDGDLSLRYTYVVAGRDYSGRMALGPVGRHALLSLAPELRRALAAHGITGFEDIPEDVRTVLASRDVTGFDAIPEPLVEDLHARGYRNPDDLPEGMRGAMARGDHAEVARQLDSLLPRTEAPAANEMPRAARIAGTRRITLSRPSSTRSSMEPTLYVFYNPAHPGEHTVSLYRWRLNNLLLLLAALGMVCTMAYGLWFYPGLVAYRRR